MDTVRPFQLPPQSTANVNQIYGIIGVLGGMLLAVLLSLASGCTSPASADSVVEITDVRQVTGHANPAPGSVEYITIGERTVEEVGTVTLVTEPGTLVLYH